MTDKKQPVVTVVSCGGAYGRREAYEKRCAELVEQGYILVSAGCAAHENVITEMFWLAVFALPKAMGKSI